MNPNALSPQTPAGAPMERRDFIVSTYKHLGVAILALLTAVGGGVLRDVLIQRTPRILYQNDTPCTSPPTICTRV